MESSDGMRDQVETHLRTILQEHGEDADSIVATQRATIDAILQNAYDGDYISLHTTSTVGIHPSSISSGEWASSTIRRASNAFRSHMSSTSLLHKTCHRILETLTIDRYFLAYAFLSAQHEPTKTQLQENYYRAIIDAYCIMGVDRFALLTKGDYRIAMMHRKRDNHIRMYSANITVSELMKEVPSDWKNVVYNIPLVPTPKTWASYDLIDIGKNFLSREVSLPDGLRDHMKFCRDTSRQDTFDIQPAIWATHLPNMVLEQDHYVLLDGRAWRPMLLIGMNWQRRRATSSDLVMIKLFHIWWTNGRTIDAWSKEDVESALSDSALSEPMDFEDDDEDDDPDGSRRLKRHIFSKMKETFMTEIDDDVIEMLKSGNGTLSYSADKDAAIPLVPITSGTKALPIYDDKTRTWFVYKVQIPFDESALLTRALLEVGSPAVIARLNENAAKAVRRELDEQQKREQAQNEELRAQEYRQNHPRRERKYVDYTQAAAAPPVVAVADDESSSSESDDDEEYDNDRDGDSDDDSDDDGDDDGDDDSDDNVAITKGATKAAARAANTNNKQGKLPAAKASRSKAGIPTDQPTKQNSETAIPKEREGPVYRVKLDRARKRQKNNEVVNMYDVVGWDVTMGDTMHVQLSIGKERVNIQFDDMANAEDFVDYGSQPVEMIVQYDNIIHSIPMLHRPAPTDGATASSGPGPSASGEVDSSDNVDFVPLTAYRSTTGLSSGQNANQAPVTDDLPFEGLEVDDSFADTNDNQMDSDVLVGDFADVFDDNNIDAAPGSSSLLDNRMLDSETDVFPFGGDPMNSAENDAVPIDNDDTNDDAAAPDSVVVNSDDEWATMLDDDMVMQRVLSDEAFIDMLGGFMENRSNAAFTAGIFDAFESTSASVPRIFDLADTLLLHMLDSTNLERPIILAFRLQNGREIALPALGSRTKLLGSRGARAPRGGMANPSSSAAPGSSTDGDPSAVKAPLPVRKRRSPAASGSNKGGAIALPVTAAPVAISAGGTMSLARDFTQVRMWADDLMQLQPFLRTIHRSLRIQTRWFNTLLEQHTDYVAAVAAADEAASVGAANADELRKVANEKWYNGAWYLVNIPTIPIVVGPDYVDGVPVVYKPPASRADSGYGAMANLTFVAKQTDQRGEDQWRARHGMFMDPATANIFANLLELQPFAFKKVRQSTRAIIDQLFLPALNMSDNGRKIVIRRNQNEWEMLLDDQIVPVFWGNRPNIEDGIEGTLHVPKRPSVGYDVHVNLTGGGTRSFPNPYAISARISKTQFENAVIAAVNNISGSNVPFVLPTIDEDEDDADAIPLPELSEATAQAAIGATSQSVNSAEEDEELPLSQLSDVDFDSVVIEMLALKGRDVTRQFLMDRGATARQMFIFANVPIEYLLKRGLPTEELLDALAEKNGITGSDVNRVDVWMQEGLPSKPLLDDDVKLSDAELKTLSDYGVDVSRKGSGGSSSSNVPGPLVDDDDL